MKRLLDIEQKIQACRIVLFNATYDMSQYEIAKRIGFVNGQPITYALSHLLANNEVIVFAKKLRTGTIGHYYRMTGEARKALRKEGWLDS